jgi:hypothetical protein
MRKLEADWDEHGWNQNSVHKQIRILITQYVAHELNQHPFAKDSLEKNPRDTIHEWHVAFMG